MTDATLTDRYIAAAMRTVPEQQRDDLAAELRGSIGDQIDARVASGESPAEAERAVLTELGDPERLAAGYTGRPLHLIGPALFLDWWRLTKLLLWIVVPLATLGIALAQALAHASFGEIVAAAVGGALGVAMQLVFWVTLVFAIVERSTSSRVRAPHLPWSVDQLPVPRQSGTGLGEVIAGLVGLFAAAAALVWDQAIGFVPGYSVSFFAESLWPAGVVYALAVLAADALLLVAVHVVGRWTPPLAIADIVLTLALAVPALWLLVDGRLLNPEFFPTILPQDGDEVQGIITVLVGFGIAISAVWGVIDTIRKTAGSRR